MMKTYLFYHWIEDHNEQIELLKNHGYLIGSFSNPEAVQSLMKGNKIEASEDAMNETLEMIRKAPIISENEKSDQGKRRRRRVK